jgi:hypothetical protein
VRGSDPPRCASHSGRTGAPAGNLNAYKHGGYARPVDEIAGIEDAVEDLQYRLTNLTHFIDQAEDKADMMPALALYGQMISRYGRLLRDARALSGESADSILELMGKAAEELATELGWTAFEG